MKKQIRIIVIVTIATMSIIIGCAQAMLTIL